MNLKYLLYYFTYSKYLYLEIIFILIYFCILFPMYISVYNIMNALI